MKPRSDHLFGMLLAVVGIIVLSPDGLILRLIDADRWTVIYWRGLLPAIALSTFLVLQYGRDVPAQFCAIGMAGLVVATLFVGATILFVCAITATTVANTLVIISATPLFAAVLSRLFLGEAVLRRTWIAAIAVLVGITVVFAGSLGSGALLGDLCAVGAACCMAGKFVVIRHARAVNMIPAVALSGFLAAVVTTPVAAPFAIGAQDLALLLLLGLVIVPVSIVLITLAPRYLPAPEVSLIMLLEAILGPLWVWLVLTEVPSRETLFGGTLIVATLAVHSALALNQVSRSAPPRGRKERMPSHLSAE